MYVCICYIYMYMDGQKDCIHILVHIKFIFTKTNTICIQDLRPMATVPRDAPRSHHQPGSKNPGHQETPWKTWKHQQGGILPVIS